MHWHLVALSQGCYNLQLLRTNFFPKYNWHFDASCQALISFVQILFEHRHSDNRRSTVSIMLPKKKHYFVYEGKQSVNFLFWTFELLFLFFLRYFTCNDKDFWYHFQHSVFSIVHPKYTVLQNLSRINKLPRANNFSHDKDCSGLDVANQKDERDVREGHADACSNGRAGRCFYSVFINL